MPETPAELINESLQVIATRISFEEGNSPESHTVVIADGLDDDGIALALARYAVAFLGGWVQRNATLADRLGVVGAEHREEIQRLVDRVTVPPAGLNEEELLNWKRTWRNAWLAEVLTHALLLVRRSHPSVCLEGDVVALLRPHPLPKRQGLDSLAIYEENATAVIAIGETKASLERGSDELTEACDLFDDVDEGLYGPDLRDAIDVLADVLPPPLASTISNDLWRDQRCYVPVVVHETAFGCTTSRPRLKRLKPAKNRKRVVLLRTGDFNGLFEDIADSMPAVIDELVV